MIGIPLNILEGSGEVLVVRLINGLLVGVVLEGGIDAAVGEGVRELVVFELGLGEVAVEMVGEKGIVAGVMGQIRVEVAAVELDA